MVILIQDNTINYIMSDSIRSIAHNTERREAIVEYKEKGKDTYIHVKEIRFNND